MGVQITVIGVGNEERGDDGVGMLVVRTLRASLAGRVRLLEVGERVDRLLEAFDDCDGAIIVDAARSGAPAGTIRRVEYMNCSFPAEGFGSSTHRLSIGEVFELARTLKKLPSRVLIYGIEGRNFSLGSSMTPDVRIAAREVSDKILEDIAVLGDGTV